MEEDLTDLKAVKNIVVEDVMKSILKEHVLLISRRIHLSSRLEKLDVSHIRALKKDRGWGAL